MNITTEEEALESVKKDGDRALKYIPEELKTEKLCHIAVEQNARELEYVPKPLKTEKHCYIAVNNNGESFLHVPDKLKTIEICFIAIIQNSYSSAIKYVPEKYKKMRLT
ncbi:MAG: DUF4116 domain-containing protein [Spirochaetaceae bacterium]|nr:DUF4116 domain-containing protein [Spirochaetaceae bacterium]